MNQTMKTPKIVTLGECMLELSAADNPGQGPARMMQLYFGGDTLNTAIYLARLGTCVGYVTALGDDGYSDWMISQWQREGIDTQWVRRCPSRTLGLYMIETDAQGERRFSYWRDQAPARELFDVSESAHALFAQLLETDYLYLSGITLSLYNEAALERLHGFLPEFRQRGDRVIYDGNYRPKSWASAQYARAVYDRMLTHTDIALPTFEDEQLLYGDAAPEQTLERLQQAGVKETVVKMGPQGCLILSEDKTVLVASEQVAKVVDTTSAGDSFNAGYLAARVQRKSPAHAAALGHRLAAIVIQHRGAIIDPRSMSQLQI